MGEFDIALICLNGHIINQEVNSFPERNSKFCENCGAETISKCKYCGAFFKGYYTGEFYDDESSYGISDPPAYCYNCGKSHPWTLERLKALNQLLELSSISEQERIDFNNIFPDIISDNPKTKVSALKIKMMGAKVGKEIWEVAKPTLAVIATAAAKQIIGIK